MPFQRGALLEQRKDYPRAETAFRQALARDPLHAPSLNYLGYMLAERGERLDEAVSLVERALAIDPDNGSYLDSLGWALFKQKKVDKAEPLLRRAAAAGARPTPSCRITSATCCGRLASTPRPSRPGAQSLGGDRDSIDTKAVEAKIARAK